MLSRVALKFFAGSAKEKGRFFAGSTKVSEAFFAGSTKFFSRVALKFQKRLSPVLDWAGGLLAALCIINYIV